MQKRKLSFKISCSLVLTVLFFASCSNSNATDEKKSVADTLKKTDTAKVADIPATNPIDTVEYNNLLKEMSNGDSSGKWPVKAPYPLPGAILPYNRVVAFYGNLYSKKMGILGELPKKQMLDKLQGEVAKWQAADSSVKVIPALHYIAVTAQGSPGKDGKYRLRMPFHQIDSIVNWAKEINALVILDIQVSHSTVGIEVPLLEKYLKMPNVHLGIDPEFSMKNSEVPGSKIGTFNDTDINFAVDYLAALVKKNNLPPKMLIVHRFTQGMVTGYDKIKKLPETQVVIDMDGWGSKILKKSTYLRYIYKEPVEFTGFKLFYKNDTKTGASQLYTPAELLKFKPKPVYIQYQ
ncbi:lipoprotein [soil metagenome]